MFRCARGQRQRWSTTCCECFSRATPCHACDPCVYPPLVGRCDDSSGIGVCSLSGRDVGALVQRDRGYVCRMDEGGVVARVALSTGVVLPYVSVGPSLAIPVLLLHAWGEPTKGGSPASRDRGRQPLAHPAVPLGLMVSVRGGSR